MGISKMAASSNVAERDFILLVEIRPLLRAANVFIQSLMFDAYTMTKIQIEKHKIEMTFGSPDLGNDKICLVLNHLSLVPGSCSGFTCVHKVIQFRVQLDEADDLSTCTKKFEALHIDENIPKPGLSYRGICSFCGTDILNRSTIFRRVLPLPSSGAVEMADGWFCHRHGDEDDFDVVRCLEPKDGDCLTGEDYMLLNSRDVDISQLVVEEAAVLCRRCLKELGKASSSGKTVMPHFRFHSYSVVLVPEKIAEETGVACSSLIPSHETVMKNAFTSLLLNNQRDMSSRLCLQTKEQEHTAILLWLMEGETMILTKYSLCSMFIDLGPARSALKLLYCIVQKDGALYRQWASDVNVTVLTIAKDLNNYALSALVDATSKLPLVCRKMDLYWVAYLQEEVSDNQTLD